MNSIWQSLLWKEWREHRWKILALTIVVVVMPLIAAVRTPAAFFTMLPVSLGFCIPVAGILFGIGAGAGENSTGTIRFLQSLPVSARRPAAAKLFWAAIAVIVPVVVATLVGAYLRIVAANEHSIREWLAVGRFTHDFYEVDARLLLFAAGPIFGGLSILIWTAALGVNRSDEVRAAAVAALVMLTYWAIAAWVGVWWPNTTFAGLVASGGPGAPWTTLRGSSRTETALIVAVLMHTALATWYVVRFGRLAPGKRQSTEAVASASSTPIWLASPRRSTLGAVAWKQFRESAPLAGLGAGLILLIAAIAAASRSGSDDESTALTLFVSAGAAWMGAGICVALVAGIGVFMDDLRPGIHSFWRSRPIDVTQWFVVKFSVGLIVTIVALVIPPALLGAAVLAGGERTKLLGLVQFDAGLSVMSTLLIAQVGLYSAAAAAMVLLRHPLYAAFTAMAAGMLGTIAFAWMHDQRWLSWNLTFGAIVCLVIGTILLAWQALRHDWGWKR